MKKIYPSIKFDPIKDTWLVVVTQTSPNIVKFMEKVYNDNQRFYKEHRQESKLIRCNLSKGYINSEHSTEYGALQFQYFLKQQFPMFIFNEEIHKFSQKLIAKLDKQLQGNIL